MSPDTFKLLFLANEKKTLVRALIKKQGNKQIGTHGQARGRGQEQAGLATKKRKAGKRVLHAAESSLAQDSGRVELIVRKPGSRAGTVCVMD